MRPKTSPENDHRLISPLTPVNSLHLLKADVSTNWIGAGDPSSPVDGHPALWNGWYEAESRSSSTRSLVRNIHSEDSTPGGTT